MKENSSEYFKIELEHFQKAYEIQFNHFMGVFYFWIGVISIPATAGLLTANSPKLLAFVFLIIAILGFFISAKMFDIRCSQFIYIFEINKARHFLREEVKKLPAEYEPSFLITDDLQKAALKDFGNKMVWIMSIINAFFLGSGIFLLLIRTSPNALGVFLLSVLLFVLGAYFGISYYKRMVNKRVPALPKSLT